MMTTLPLDSTHHSNVCGETEAKAGIRQGHHVGLIGVLRGRLIACMARLCYAVGILQKHADDVGRGMAYRPEKTHTVGNDERGIMTSPPFDSTHGR